MYVYVKANLVFLLQILIFILQNLNYDDFRSEFHSSKLFHQVMSLFTVY